MSELTQSTISTGPAHAQSGYSEQSSTHGKSAETAQAGKQAAGEVAQTAANNAKNVAQETKTQARNLASEARDQLREQSGVQQKNLVNSLRSLADELGSMAQNGEQSGRATDLVGQASDRAHSAASWLDDRDPGQLVDELRSLARRKPAAFLVGALAAGVVAGRLTRGVKDAHSDTQSDHSSDPSSAVDQTYAGSTDPMISAPAIDAQQLPSSGAAYPPATGDAAFPAPLPTERIGETEGGRW